MVKGPNRNFQVFDPLDFLAAVTSHILDRGEHLVRYYGWYSSVRRTAAAAFLCPAPIGHDMSDAVPPILTMRGMRRVPGEGISIRSKGNSYGLMSGDFTLCSSPSDSCNIITIRKISVSFLSE